MTWLEREGVCCHYPGAVQVPMEFFASGRERCRGEVVPGLIPLIYQDLVLRYHFTAFPITLDRGNLDAATEARIRALSPYFEAAFMIAWPSAGTEQPSAMALARAARARGLFLARWIRADGVDIELLRSTDPRVAACMRPEGETYELSFCGWWTGGGDVHQEPIPGASFSVVLPSTSGDLELELCKNRVCSGARVLLPVAAEGERVPETHGRLAGGLRSVFLVERAGADLRLTVRAPSLGIDTTRTGDEFALRVTDVESGQVRCERSWSATYSEDAVFNAELACRWYSPWDGPRICRSD